jgi:hypothetical protein
LLDSLLTNLLPTLRGTDDVPQTLRDTPLFSHGFLCGTEGADLASLTRTDDTALKEIDDITDIVVFDVIAFTFIDGREGVATFRE